MAVHTQVLPVPADTPYRLGRHVERDDRSRDHEFSLRRTLDQNVLWSTSKPVLNQWTTNSCVGNTVAQCLNTDFFTAVRTANKVSWYTERDALSCYHLATLADGINTDYYPPNDNGTSALGGAKAAQELGWVDHYTHAFDFPTFLSAIQTQPVCVGTLWTNSMFSPDPSGLVSVGGLSEDTIAGGHEYLALGVNYDSKKLAFLTSWGPDFGVGGHFTMSFSDFESLLDQEGDVLVLHGTGMS